MLLKKKRTPKAGIKKRITKAKGATKEEPKIVQEQEHAEESAESAVRYWEAVGRRKTAVARVRLFTRGEKEIVVNEKPYRNYFPLPEIQDIVTSPLVRMKNIEKFRVLVHVSGGGMRGQAEAIRHAISRALVKFNPDFKKRLRRVGFLTRDPRMKERKKFGLKGARRAPQWQKR